MLAEFEILCNEGAYVCVCVDIVHLNTVVRERHGMNVICIRGRNGYRGTVHWIVWCAAIAYHDSLFRIQHTHTSPRGRVCVWLQSTTMERRWRRRRSIAQFHSFSAKSAHCLYEMFIHLVHFVRFNKVNCVRWFPSRCERISVKFYSCGFMFIVQVPANCVRWNTYSLCNCVLVSQIRLPNAYALRFASPLLLLPSLRWRHSHKIYVTSDKTDSKGAYIIIRSRRLLYASIVRFVRKLKLKKFRMKNAFKNSSKVVEWNWTCTYFHSKSDEIKMTNKRNIEQTAMMADVCTVVLLR